MTTGEVIAIIPARGGSKGIPRKNVIDMAGAPLVAHSIAHAADSRHVDRVVVSTDDDEIAAVSQAHGAEVVRRPDPLGSDLATSESALIHALDTIVDGGTDPDLIVFLQATSPLRRPDDIDRAVEQLRSNEADSLFSAHRLHTFIWQQRGDVVDSVTYDYKSRQRRQDRDVIDWVENGSIYVFKPWVLRDLDNRLGGRIEVFEMDEKTSFQIDEPADLEMIELLARVIPPSSAAS